MIKLVGIVTKAVGETLLRNVTQGRAIRCLSSTTGTSRLAAQPERSNIKVPTSTGLWTHDKNKKPMVPKKVFGNGHVSSRLPKGRFYTGGFLDNQPHGYGQMLTSTDKRIKLSGIADSVLTGGDKLYIGFFDKGTYHGFGELTYPNGQRLTGEFKKGHICNGEGLTLYKDNSAYEGQYKNGLKHGKGIFIYPDGKKLFGEFREGVIFEGEGHNVVAPDHIEFGAWKDGHFRGQVLNSAGDVVSTHSFKVDANGVVSSVNAKGAMLSGPLVNHKLHGEGKIIYPSGLIVEGTFDHHKLHGEGKVTQPDGRILQGEFRYGAIYTGQGVEVNYRNTGKVREGVWVGGVFTGTCS